MQKCFNFQIQKIQSANAICQIELILHSLYAQSEEGISVSVDFCQAEDYCNILVESGRYSDFWIDFARLVSENPSEFDWIKKRWIVVLQGESTWDDYLLLAHFDPLEDIDHLKL